MLQVFLPPEKRLTIPVKQEQGVEGCPPDTCARAQGPSECFIDGTFIVAKKGRRVDATKRGKGAKLLVLTDAHGLPIAAVGRSSG
jgi:hypothetical protein